MNRRWIREADIVRSGELAGAFAWSVPSLKGIKIGTFAHRDEEDLMTSLREAKSKLDRDKMLLFATEIAAKRMAAASSMELSHSAWIWKSPLKKQLIAESESIINGV